MQVNNMRIRHELLKDIEVEERVKEEVRGHIKKVYK